NHAVTCQNRPKTTIRTGGEPMIGSMSQPTRLPIELFEECLFMRAPRPTQVLSAFFDNRGQVTLNMSASIDITSLSRKTAALWTAGPDTILGNADDTRLYTAVGYRKGLITLRADTALNQRY